MALCGDGLNEQYIWILEEISDVNLQIIYKDMDDIENGKEREDLKKREE